MKDIIPELTVPLHVWIISQVFMTIALVIAMSALQVRSKIKTMLLIAGACLFNALGCAFQLNWVVFTFVAITAVRMLFFAYFEKRNQSGRAVGRWCAPVVLIVAVVATIIVVSFTWAWWFDWVLLVASCLTVLGTFLRGIHFMRLAMLTYDICVIVNYAVFVNIIGIVMELLLIGSAVVFYIRLACVYFRDKRA